MLKPLQSSLLPPAQRHANHLRVATYNIHKGVRGMGPTKRLEIHNLSDAVSALDADIVCLQEVRQFNHAEARRFSHTQFGPDAWPSTPQAEYLAPEGYEVAYRTNAITKNGEHGNALLARWPLGPIGHHNVSDHRFEQRGLLHVQLLVDGKDVHVVVVHFGLIHASRERQVQRLGEYVATQVPAGAPLIVAGDFNDWGAQLLKPMAALDLRTFDGIRLPTYPSRLPLLHLDRIFVRGLQPISAHVPHGRAWSRMSDHLPLIGEFEL